MFRKLILAGLCILLAVTIGTSVMMWQSLVATRDVNQQLLEEIRTLAARPSPAPASNPVASDWNPLLVRLVLDGLEKKPAEGMSVDLYGESGKAWMLGKKSTVDGIADFGQIRNGQYELRVSTSWGASLKMPLFIRPGEAPLSTIVCPPPPQIAPVEISIEVDYEEAAALTSLETPGYFMTLVVDNTIQAGDKAWLVVPRRGFQVRVEPTGQIQVALPDGSTSKIISASSFSLETDGRPFRVAQVDFAQVTKDRPESGRHFSVKNARAPLANLEIMSRTRQRQNNRAIFLGLFYEEYENTIQLPYQETLSLSDETTMVAKVTERNVWRIPLFKTYVIPASNRYHETIGARKS